MKFDKILTLLDLGVFFLLFFGGMKIGSYVSENDPNTWITWNRSMVSVILIGELVWWRIRKVIVERSRKHNRQKK